MKRLLILLFVLMNLSALGQTYTAERIVATRGFYLKDRWVDSIGVDTTMSGEIRSLPSSDAVYRLIHGRLTNLSIPYSAITGKPDLVLQATLDDSTSVLRDSINALRVSLSSTSSLPDQTGNAGKYLTTDGTTASWGDLRPSLSTLTDGATVTWDYATQGTEAKVTLAGNRTLSITNLPAGEVVYLTLEVIQDATGSRTLTLPASTKVIGGGAGAVTLTTTGGATDLLTFRWNGTTLFANLGTNYN
jgi:hypothetical protein